MILYLTDRSIKVKGLATSDGRSGLAIIDDNIKESVAEGIKVLTATIAYDAEMYEQAVEMIKPTNYILCESNSEQLFFTIIETELDVKARTISIYAEDSGLDMINDIAGVTSFGTHELEYYVQYYINGSGFEVGNIDTWHSPKALRFDSEETVIARLRKIAEAFNTEISFRFEIDGLNVTHKYIDMAQRGENNGVRLMLNREVENITISQDASNVATALRCIGGTAEGSNTPITLRDYVATSADGDCYTIAGSKLVISHSALENYERMNWSSTVEGHGNLIKRFKYDTLSQAELFEKACEELTRIKEVAVTYDVEVADLGNKTVNIGDTIYIVDDNEEIYLEARVLEIERSESNNSIKLTLGDYIRRDAGISEKVQELAEQFAEQASKVNAAVAKAEEAVEAVEYKNSIVYAAEEPNKADKVVNDIWFDTSNGNTPYQFDGTEWVEQTWGADAIRIAELFAQVVTATNLTVTGNSNIVGGKIGGFTIQNDRIIYKKNNNTLLNIIAGDDAQIGYTTSDGSQFGRFGYHQGDGATKGGLVLSNYTNTNGTDKLSLQEQYIEFKNTSPSGTNVVFSRFGQSLERGTYITTAGRQGLTVDGKTPVYTDYLIYDTNTIATAKSIPANSYTEITADVSRSNYTPIGIVGVIPYNGTGGSNSAFCLVQRFYIRESDKNAVVYLRNVGSSIAKIDVQINVLYRRN